MAPGVTLQGRRIEGDDAFLKFPGDYYLNFKKTAVRAILPEGTSIRIPTQYATEEEGARWTVTEEDDGTITLSPSIFYNPPDGWHGFLEHGVWREV